MQNRASSIEKSRLITRRVFMLAAAKLLLIGGITSKFPIEKNMNFFQIKIELGNGKHLHKEDL